MKIEGTTSQEWKLYDYLKNNAVGKKNIKSRKKIAEDLNYNSFEEVQADIRALRLNKAITRDICSTTKGYYLPISKEERSYFLRGRAIGHLLTALTTGELSKNEVYKILNDFDETAPVDKQMKLILGEYEKDSIKKLSDDLASPLTPEEQLKVKLIAVPYAKLQDIYWCLGGTITLPLAKIEYVNLISEMCENNETRTRMVERRIS